MPDLTNHAVPHGAAASRACRVFHPPHAPGHSRPASRTTVRPKGHSPPRSCSAPPCNRNGCRYVRPDGISFLSALQYSLIRPSRLAPQHTAAFGKASALWHEAGQPDRMRRSDQHQSIVPRSCSIHDFLFHPPCNENHQGQCMPE